MVGRHMAERVSRAEGCLVTRFSPCHWKDWLQTVANLKGKPAAAMEGILKGKLNKYFETNCLLEQGFVKNPDLKVEAHLGAVGKQLGDTLTIRRFLRFQVGE